MAANPHRNDSQHTGSVIKQRPPLNLGLRVPPVPRQRAHTDVCAGGWADGGQWWSELRWCGSAGSQSRSSGWCWGLPVWPRPLDSSGLQRQEVGKFNMRHVYYSIFLTLKTKVKPLKSIMSQTFWASHDLWRWELTETSVAELLFYLCVFISGGSKYSPSSQMMAMAARTMRSLSCSPSVPTAIRELATEVGNSIALTVIIYRGR